MASFTTPALNLYRYRSIVAAGIAWQNDRANIPYSLYNYVPNRGFNIFAAVVWGIVMLVHLAWIFVRSKRAAQADTGFTAKERTKSIQALFFIGSVLEFIVYILRSINHTRPFQGRMFIAQYVLNTTAPLYFVMAMQLGLMKALAQPREHHLLAFNRPKTVIYILLGLSVVALILNAIGSAIWTTMVFRILRGDSFSINPRNGRNTLLAGQAIEFATLTLTLGLLTWVLLKFIRTRTRNVYFINKLFLIVLYLTLGMLWTRALYRLIETSQGLWGTAWSSEALFGVFDFATTWVAVTIWAAWPMRNALNSVKDDHYVGPGKNRMSHDTTYTGNTMVGNNTTTAAATTAPGPTTTPAHTTAPTHTADPITVGHGAAGTNNVV